MAGRRPSVSRRGAATLPMENFLDGLEGGN
jgi:hypothetical protein